MRTLLELRLAVEAPACRLARNAATEAIEGHVTESARDIARLVITELVANAVRHSNASAEDGLVVRVWLGTYDLRLEVEDPGGGGRVRLRPPGIGAGGGLGLNLVDSLSQRWAVERVPGVLNRVWADVGRGRASVTGLPPGRQVSELGLGPPRSRASTSNGTEITMLRQSNAGPAPKPTAPIAGRPGSAEPRRDEVRGPSSRPPGTPGQANRARAHKTVTGTAEAAPGAPRSGSA